MRSPTFRGVSGRLSLMLFVSLAAIISCSGGTPDSADQAAADEAGNTWQGVSEAVQPETWADIPVTDEVAEASVEY